MCYSYYAYGQVSNVISRLGNWKYLYEKIERVVSHNLNLIKKLLANKGNYLAQSKIYSLCSAVGKW